MTEADPLFFAYSKRGRDERYHWLVDYERQQRERKGEHCDRCGTMIYPGDWPWCDGHGPLEAA